MIRLNGRVCVVRAFETGDVTSLARHADNREIWLNLRDLFPHPYREEHAQAYIASVLAENPTTKFAIDVDGAAVGSIGLKPGTDVERVGAELGFWLGEEFWGRGIVSEAIGAVTAYGFEKLGLQRIFALPYAHNAASSRVLEKNGYKLEGRLRRAAIKDGQLLDQLLYAKLRPST